MKRSLYSLAALGLALTLSACGFHLRGTGDTAFALKSIDLQARDAYGDTVKQLRQTLVDNDVRVVDGARYKLTLGRQVEDRRTASYTGTARAAEYELTTRQPYTISTQDGLVLVQDSIQVQKVYLNDENNIIGSQQEADQLRREMSQQLVQLMLLKLRVITPDQLDSLTEQARAKREAEAEAIRRANEPVKSPESPIQWP